MALDQNSLLSQYATKDASGNIVAIDPTKFPTQYLEPGTNFKDNQTRLNQDTYYRIQREIASALPYQNNVLTNLVFDSLYTPEQGRADTLRGTLTSLGSEGLPVNFGGHEDIDRNFGGFQNFSSYLLSGGKLGSTLNARGQSVANPLSQLVTSPLNQSAGSGGTKFGGVTGATGSGSIGPDGKLLPNLQAGQPMSPETVSQTPQQTNTNTVTTSQPSPTTVQAQPFTNPGTNIQTTGTQEGDIAAGLIQGGVYQPQATPVPSKFEQGFNQANTDLQGAVPTSGTQGSTIVQQYAPNKPNNPASNFVQSDPYMDTLVKSWQEYINPTNQRASLTDTYNQLVKSSGIEGIDTQLINMKNIIDGNEDSIRKEIQAAGGFATDGQVLALTAARNKSLIQNYNTLLQTRDAKEKYLQTTIQLEQQDRQAADQRFNTAFNMGLQLADYHQKMESNALAAFDRARNAIGWNGILQSLQGDPSAIALIEKSYGLPSGGLQLAAQQERQAQAQEAQQQQLALQEKQLNLQLKGEQIKTEQAQRAKIYSSGSGGFGGLSSKPLNQAQLSAKGYYDRTVAADKVINELGNKFTGVFSYIGQYAPNILKSADRQRYEQAQRDFINAVLRPESGAAISPSEFDNAYRQYFPQPGDSAPVVAQKAQNRQIKINALALQGGQEFSPSGGSDLRSKYNY